MLSTIKKNHDGLPVCDCTDNFPNFVCKPHGHVHTGNLDLIDNTQLRSLMKKWATFRETPSCSKYKLDNLYQDAIDKLTTKLAWHSKSKSGIFYHWKNIIRQEFKLILEQLPSQFPSSQTLNRPEDIKYLKHWKVFLSIRIYNLTVLFLNRYLSYIWVEMHHPSLPIYTYHGVNIAMWLN